MSNSTRTNTRRRIDGRIVYFTDEGNVAAGAHDDSPVAAPSTHYTAECSACWVGRPHTIGYHNSKVGR